MRVTLDRTSPLYKAIYRQHTSTERINSHAKALGIECPKVRNPGSVENLNTLTHIVINAKAHKPGACHQCLLAHSQARQGYLAASISVTNRCRI